MLEITQSLPGRRFQDRYRRKHAQNASAWKRCAWFCAGILLTLVGVFFLAVPGPGIPILAVGLALLAQESVTLARWLDRTELRLRRWWKKLRR
jgi:Putative transmembrane protein (PGPGW)